MSLIEKFHNVPSAHQETQSSDGLWNISGYVFGEIGQEYLLVIGSRLNPASFDVMFVTTMSDISAIDNLVKTTESLIGSSHSQPGPGWLIRLGYLIGDEAALYVAFDQADRCMKLHARGAPAYVSTSVDFKVLEKLGLKKPVKAIASHRKLSSTAVNKRLNVAREKGIIKRSKGGPRSV